jgi:hypothetical protein
MKSTIVDVISSLISNDNDKNEPVYDEDELQEKAGEITTTRNKIF